MKRKKIHDGNTEATAADDGSSNHATTAHATSAHSAHAAHAAIE